MAWTTGSELIRELGQEMKKLEQKHGGEISTNKGTKMDLDAFAPAASSGRIAKRWSM